MNNSFDLRTEEIRKKYHPEKVQVLFIGESPPASGKFFYKGDSGLAQFTEQAFSNAYKITFSPNLIFLDCFKKAGCYLDDLCLYPINRINDDCREIERIKGIKDLSNRIGSEKPKAIITVINNIMNHVNEAIRLAKMDKIKPIHLPFPCRQNKERYVSGLTGEICKLVDAGILPKKLQ